MTVSTSETAELWRYPLVVLPGFMSDSRVWDPLVRVLSRYLPVMVAPVRGAERVEDVAEELLCQLPIRFSVVGADLGGSVAMALLQKAPERVVGIGLIGASPLPETPAQAAEREPWIIQARTGRLRAVMQEVCPITSLAPGHMRGKIMSDLADMAEDLGPEVFVEQSRMMQRRCDMQAVLRRAVQPSLLISGVHDTIVPVKRQLFTAELMRQARLELIEDAGHMPLLEQPEQVTQILFNWIMQGAVSKKDLDAGASPDGRPPSNQPAAGKPPRRRFSRPMFQMVGEMQEDESGLGEDAVPARFASIRRDRGAQGPFLRTG